MRVVHHGNVGKLNSPLELITFIQEGREQVAAGSAPQPPRDSCLTSSKLNRLGWGRLLKSSDNGCHVNFTTNCNNSFNTPSTQM